MTTGSKYEKINKKSENVLPFFYVPSADEVQLYMSRFPSQSYICSAFIHYK